MKGIEHDAYQFRIDNLLLELPIDYQDVLKIIKRYGYRLRSYAEAQKELENLGLNQAITETDAFLIKVSNKEPLRIYYDDTMSAEHKRDALVHEIAHIRCGHVKTGEVLGYSKDRASGDPMEVEAEDWRRYFLAPPRIVKMRGGESIAKIQELAHISKLDAAQVLIDVLKITNDPIADVERTLCKLMEAEGIPLEPPKEDHTPTISLGNLILVGVITVIFFSVVVLGVYASGGALPGGSGQSSMVGVSSVLDTSETISSAPSEALPPSSQAASRSPAVQQPAKVSSKTSTRAPSASKPAQLTVTSKPQATYTPPAPPPEPSSSSRVYQASSKAPVQKSGITVYITQGGDKFHKLGCQHINGKPVAALDRNEALDEGFEACLTCKP